MVKTKNKGKTKRPPALTSGNEEHRNQKEESSIGTKGEEVENLSLAQDDLDLNDVELRLRNLEILQNEFPILDASLISAIHSDTPLDLQASRKTLSSIAKVTALDEIGNNSTYGDDNTTTEASWVTPTSTADASSQTAPEEFGEVAQTKDEKIKQLNELFPALSPFVIAKALEKGQGSLDRAAEELCNYSDVKESTLSERCREDTSRNEFPLESGSVYLKGADDREYFTPKNAVKRSRNTRKNERKIIQELDKQEMFSSTSMPAIPRSARSENRSPQGKLVSWLPSGTQTSTWTKMEIETSFISSALNLPNPKVVSAYHKHNGSLSETIYYLLDQHVLPTCSNGLGSPMSPTLLWEYEIGQEEEHFEYIEQFADLIEIFPGMEENDLWRLLKQVMLSSDSKNQGKKGDIAEEQSRNLQNLFQIAEFLSQNPRIKARSSGTISVARGASSLGPRAQSSIIGPPSTASPTQEYTIINSRSSVSSSSTKSNLPYFHDIKFERLHAARGNALENAYRQFKRSKSDPLHGAAASYYSDQAFQLSSLVRTHFSPSTAWDKLHESGGYKKCATHTMLDLHGLTLPEAVLVTKAIVREWWKEENERKELMMEKMVRPLIVITGVGRHSRDGRGVLGGGIVRVLKNGGWRLVWDAGEVRVTGREKGK